MPTQRKADELEPLDHSSFQGGLRLDRQGLKVWDGTQAKEAKGEVAILYVFTIKVILCIVMLVALLHFLTQILPLEAGAGR